MNVKQNKPFLTGFKCTSFLNHPAKQLVIVHRGTENFEQVKTDIMLAFKVVTLEVIQKADWLTYQHLLNNALKEENKKVIRNDYSVTLTGHSLGGWLAQICTLLCKYPKYHPFVNNGSVVNFYFIYHPFAPRGNITFPNGSSINMNQSYDVHCVAFDSPGASNQVELTSKATAWLIGVKRDVENALKSLDITVYLSNRNVVNSCGEHVGTVKRIDVMEDEYWWAKLNPITSHSMEKILKYFKRHN